MADVNITAETRTEFGKGAARRIRRDAKVPGVVYGHGAEPAHVVLPGHQLMMALKTSNVLIALEVDGETELAIPKAVQRDPLKGFLVHIDLLTVKRGEKVQVEIPIQAEGDLAPGANLLEYVLSALPVTAEATSIPDFLTVSIAGLDAGDAILAKDITLAEGVALDVEDDTVVLQVLAAQAEEAPAEGEEGAEA
ncbi:50S ribosomal protein L25/general stress protein Ctc [Streptomyces sp. SID8014]|uniref:50S ribosomal protein L25/general stress protein Ctc n=1 Tax=Streptomyces sp. SID8014 TaxID=2706097 RepID=UPI0013B8817B|nr:50S ribosomal protein L25/general stress protein Ctc [Streptomyces sp. SID8014]NEC15504.1 50S ribosomal protein L25/general stress protein Ctc [Streptomyces sp. SID8014]